MIDDVNEEPEENIIEEVKKQTKIKNKLKKEGIVRPTLEEIGEGRKTRGKQVDYKKLNRGY